MTTTTTDFISITRAAKDYPTSRRTIERKREKARKAGDNETLDAFMIRTKDGHEYKAPNEQLAHQLSKDGRQPETFVSRDWLESTFRQHQRQPDASARQHDLSQRRPRQGDGGGVTGSDATDTDPITAALLNQLVKKDEQLQTQSELIKALTERQRESNILLSQFQKQLPQQAKQVSQVVDTTPKPQPVTQKPRPKSKPKSTPTQPKKEASKQSSAKQRSTIGRFFFGIKK